MESLKEVLKRQSDEVAWNWRAKGRCHSEVGGSVKGPRKSSICYMWGMCVWGMCVWGYVRMGVHVSERCGRKEERSKDGHTNNTRQSLELPHVGFEPTTLHALDRALYQLSCLGPKSYISLCT